MTLWLVACVALLGAAPHVTDVQPKQATDELFRAMPREVAAVAVLEDLDGFLSRLEQSDVLKRLRRSKFLSTAVEGEVARRWRQFDKLVRGRLSVGLDVLRRDVFGLSVALAYWPKSGRERDEAGLLLVRARSAERLEETLQALFRFHGAAPPRRTHEGVGYWTSRAGERRQFLLALGPIGLLTDDEEAVQRVIQTSKGAKSWADEPVYAAMRQSTPTGALVSVFLLPRNLDAKLQEKPVTKPGEAKLRETVLAVWQTIDWVSFTAHVESRLECGLHASVDRTKLPSELARRPSAGSGPVLTQGLEGTLASASVGADFAALTDLVGRLAVEGNPQDAAAGAKFLRGLFMGLGGADVAAQLGPRLGLAILEGASSTPDVLFAVEVRPSKAPNAVAPFEDLLEQALRFAALALTIEANKHGKGAWEMRTELIDGCRVHIATGGTVPGVEPCFTVRDGWMLAATSPSVLRRALNGSRQPASPDEIGRLDLQAVRRLVAQRGFRWHAELGRAAALLEPLADAIPMLLLKRRVDGAVHHWTVESPPPK